MPHRLTAFLILFLVPSAVRSQALEAGAFSIPTLAATARGAALGGSPIAVPGRDGGRFLYNPALLGPVDDGVLTLGYLDHLSSVRVGGVSYARSLGTVGMLAGSLRYLGWGAVPRTDESGGSSGTFRPGEVALSATLARPHGSQFRYGFTLHFMRSAIDGQAAMAIAVDAGAAAWWEEHLLGLAVSVHQVGVPLSSLGESTDDLPLDVRIGVSKRLRHLPLLFSLTAYGLHDVGDYEDAGGFTDRLFRHLLLGAEFQFSDAFQVRFGYDWRQHAALRTGSRLDVAGLSLGSGIRVGRFGFDYAWTSWSSLGGLHWLTVATSLQGRANRP